jgi:hypothetical protein
VRLLHVRESGSDAVGAERCRNCSDAAVSTGLPVGTRSMHVRVRPSVAAFDRAGGVAGTEDTAAFGPWAVARSWRARSGVGRAGEPAIGDEQGA